jgi:glycosyltransferase involved in cell wall biosynthesis
VSAPRLSVIIPARNAQDTLADTLAGLSAQAAGFAFEVIVVDDGSGDGTRRIAASSAVVGQVIVLPGLGPARARNAGAAAATGSALAFLDADCVPAPGWVAAGVSALAQSDLVLGETRPDPAQRCGPFDRTLSVVGRSPLFESANLFVRRELFERIGGFESWLGPRGGKELGEDVWFGWRAERLGARTSACARALAHHAVHPGTARTFIAERGRLRYFPALVARIPELRRELCYRGVFLNQRSARFDLAVIALGLAGLTRRGGVAAGALPYGVQVWRDLREPHGAEKAVVRPVADAVGLAALLGGSVRYRSLLL